MVDTQGVLWGINMSTGAATSIGSTLIDAGAGSLAVSTGSSSLYVASGNNVYSVNTATGASTLLGSSTDPFGALSTVGGTLYGSSIANTSELSSFNTSTGASTVLTPITGASNYLYGFYGVSASAVPEPGSLALFGLAGSLLGGFALKRQCSPHRGR